MSIRQSIIGLSALCLLSFAAALPAQQPAAERPAASGGQPDQQAPAEKAPAKIAERQTQIIRLQYALAHDLATTIHDVLRTDRELSDLQFVPELATNSLIVSGSPHEMEKVASLVKVFDVPEAAKERPVTEVLQLKQADASASAEVLQALYGDQPNFRLSVDESSNSIIVHALPSALGEIKTLVQKLGESRSETQVRIFSLENIAPDKKLLDILSAVCQSGDARFGIDEPRNALIAAGSPATLSVVETLLMRLDQPAARPAKSGAGSSASLQVRVVWLVSGLNIDGAAAPGADLADVTAELARIGFVDPQVAANVVVNASSGNEFRLAGAGRLDKPCDLEISGQIVSPPGEDSPLLNIQIFASEQGESDPRRGFGNTPRQNILCSLNTTISAPLAHHVVLGVSPLRNMNSAFVVQVSAPAKAADNTGSGASPAPRRR